MLLKRNRILSVTLAILMLCTIFTGCSQNVFKSVEQQQIEQEVKESLFTNLNEESIDANNIMSIIEELSSEKYLGRLPGTEGNRLAAKYIIDYFKEIGLENPEGLEDYKQYYNQKVLFTNSAPILELVNEDGDKLKEYNYITQFSPGIGGINVIKGEVTAPCLIMDDVKQYAIGNEELRGKILLIPDNIITELNSDLEKTQDYSAFNWIMSQESGVKGIVAEIDLRKPSHIQKYFPVSKIADHIDRSDKTKGLIQVGCNTPYFNEIKREAENGALIHISVDYSVEEVVVPNIIGVIPGTDEKLKNEYIIISGHFDHVGDNKDGTYNPGALDNASGTAAMMEIARILMENEVKPKKSIVFIAFNGEEELLKGSKYYTENPVFPLDNTVLINMDMVGSTRKPLFVMDAMLEENKLKDEIYKYVQQFGIDSYNGRTNRSDHTHFEEKGVEAITLIQPDEKSGYHSPKDTIKLVNKTKIKLIIKPLLYYLDKNAY
ncbi:M20/M25/M40 family metallo-hydrolase [Abyssisolibacter fermentans]|uniref:M20/M25/M40 family metallo-hydrolase n=1 Tax=Abyssisolibacter fermentans TaxID=1766203 RepID=UPI00082BB6ED|nr:M20/M25/M40 family metallo-hydrolase [Abyssisolibacter fermentans]